MSFGQILIGEQIVITRNSLGEHGKRLGITASTKGTKGLQFFVAGGLRAFQGPFSLLRTISKVNDGAWFAGLKGDTGLPSIDWITSPACRPASNAAV